MEIGSDFSLPEWRRVSAVFAPTTDVFCKDIHYPRAKGVMAGCGATQYCPGDAVKRDAMAGVLGNAFDLQLYGP